MGASSVASFPPFFGGQQSGDHTAQLGKFLLYFEPCPVLSAKERQAGTIIHRYYAERRQPRCREPHPPFGCCRKIIKHGLSDTHPDEGGHFLRNLGTLFPRPLDCSGEKPSQT